VGEQLAHVLVSGLRVLRPDLLRRFLVQPGLLLDLQERVVIEGGPYWERVAQLSPEMENLIERGWHGISEKLGNAATDTPAATDDEPPATVPLRPRSASWFTRPWLVSLATAAAVLLGVFVYQHYHQPAQPEVATAWGWNRSDALPRDVPAQAYLNRLADEANEWFAQRPEGNDAVALAQRLAEMREGCSVLILSQHHPLDETTSKELVERCKKWAGQFDQQLTALEGGAKPEAVREQTDNTVRTLIKWLRNEAEKAAA
jgi:hypothetical protein